MAGFWLANVLPTTLPGWTFNDVNVGEPILDSEVPDADGNNGEVPIIVEVIVMQSPLEHNNILFNLTVLDGFNLM